MWRKAIPSTSFVSSLSSEDSIFSGNVLVFYSEVELEHPKECMTDLVT